MTFLRGRAELGVAAFLALVGVVVLVDGLGLPTVSAAADPVGTRPMPLVVGAMLVVCAVFLALDVVRGGRGEVEGGEDVDLDHPSDWRTVGLLLVAFVANIAAHRPPRLRHLRRDPVLGQLFRPRQPAPGP